MEKIILDDLDCFIILEIWEAALENKELTTWSIAESYFTCDEKNKTRFLTAKCNMVSNRLSNMKRNDFIEIKKEGRKNTFILNTDNVFLKKTKFPDNKIKDSIAVKGKDNRWMIFQV